MFFFVYVLDPGSHCRQPAQSVSPGTLASHETQLPLAPWRLQPTTDGSHRVKKRHVALRHPSHDCVLSQIRTAKILAWAAAAYISILIIASHKHYTVDVTVAWYTVPLVFYALERRWTTRRGETSRADSTDTQMKSLREVLIREGDRSQHNGASTVGNSEASTAGFNGSSTSGFNGVF